MFYLNIRFRKNNDFQLKVTQVLTKFKTIDLLINNGGISQRSYAFETQIEVDRKIMEINYFGTVALTKSVLPTMQNQKSGHIVTICSSSGKFGFFLRSSYSASKFAQVGFFESLRLEEKNNIKVTLVFPFLVKTNISLNAVSHHGDILGKNDPLIENGISPENVLKTLLMVLWTVKKKFIQVEKVLG